MKPTHICVTNCQHRNRVYIIGEKLEAMTGEKIPRHFELIKDHKPVAPETVDEPKTFKDLAKQETALEEKPVLLKMNKDDLVAKAQDLGLSDGRDLIAFTKNQLADLIVEAAQSKAN